MKRTFAALMTAAFLAAMLPGAAGAAKVTKFSDHRVSFFCESPIDGGFVIAFGESSTVFGSFADFALWLDPAEPFVEPATATGVTESLDVTEDGTNVTAEATFEAVDGEGNPVGEATLHVALAADGPPLPPMAFPHGNHKSKTVELFQPLAGTGTLGFDGAAYEVPCFGELVDADVWENNPTSFVAHTEGILLDCFWVFDGGFAGAFAINDTFGFFADAQLGLGDVILFPTEPGTGSIDATGVSAEWTLDDEFGTSPTTATLEGTFTVAGGPVTSKLVYEDGMTKAVETPLSVEGSLEFSTGHSFDLNDEACSTLVFDNDSRQSAPRGPRPAAPPANDAIEDAIALAPGDAHRANTTGAETFPELPNDTCPAGPFDGMGATVWYTVEGTGGEITIDSAGTDFDTVMAVYTFDGADLVEIACLDDVEFEPVGATLQAAITIDTEPGTTYYVQVGGWMPFFAEDAERGRLRIAVW